ncbi:MAG: PDZ domain-containing protein, partial [Candidatus Bathyarchaeia archaeon]
NITYGRYVGTVYPDGPSAGKLKSGDIIIAINGTTIKNSDDLSSYLEGQTMPGDLVVITVVRDNSTITVEVTLGTRPKPPT